MSWVFLVIIGGTINALINYSFKTYGQRINAVHFIGFVMAVAAASMAAYALSRNAPVGSLLEPNTLLPIIAMGSGMAVVWVLTVTALARGPISLVDPLWACVYALVSVVIGMVLASENPSLLSLLGVAIYLAGAILMAYGARQKERTGNITDSNGNIRKLG